MSTNGMSTNGLSTSGTTTDTMRAVLADRYGSPDVLSIREVPRPKAGAGEVRVHVHATTVSRTDCGNLRGHPRLARIVTGLFRPKRPILGVDFAGIVDEVGPGVSRFEVGDRVFGMAPGGTGAHAEYLCAPANGAIAPMPEELAFTEAVVGEGVWYASTYLDAFGVKPGDRLLIYGASGAIGTAAVQLAKARGAEVTAVVDSARVELARSLGADRVIDYTAEDYTQVDDRLDFVLDAVGKAHYARARSLLHREGIYSAADFGPGNENLWFLLRSQFVRTRRFIFPFPKDPEAAIRTAAKRLASGELRAVVDRIHPLDEIVEAYHYVESAQKTGIVVIEMVPERHK